MTSSTKRQLDRKLQSIRDGRYLPADFILADAKDADMAFGATAPGPVTNGSGFRTRNQFLDDIEAQIRLGQFDIMLTSASNAERLRQSNVLDDETTLAIRANDSTDIWNQRGSVAPATFSRPFRTAHLPSVRDITDLVLYSVTLNNDIDADRTTLEAFSAFRVEAAELGVRYFLEVFNPNQPIQLTDEAIGPFVNDSIIRMLAGVTSAHRPLFLKMAYNGHDSLRELVDHDPSVIVGVLGGSAGTTRDTFELLHRAESAGARVALFGRKIQRAESQLALAGLMRPVLERKLTPSEAVRSYHDALSAASLQPMRSLNDDLEVTDPVLRAE